MLKYEILIYAKFIREMVHNSFWYLAQLWAHEGVEVEILSRITPCEYFL